MQIETKLPAVGTTIFTVMSQLAIEHKAINLGQGFPDFDPPPALVDALTRAMREGHNQYAPMTGITALREQIALKTERLYGRRIGVDTEITVTSGATEALFAAIACSVRAGEEVIVLDPCYDSYQPAIDLQGARAVHVPLALAGFFRGLAARARRDHAVHAHDHRQQPAQPIGRGVLRRRSRCAGGAGAGDTGCGCCPMRSTSTSCSTTRSTRACCATPALAERSFVVSSFGKTYHCTGWKLGYCIAPKTLSAEFRKVHQYLTFCSFQPAQWAFAEMLAQSPAHYLDLPAFYQAKRDHFRALLAPSRLKLLAVPGGYFQLADYSAIRDVDDLNFCDWLVREVGVAAIPLSPFYETPPDARLLRFCFAKSDATLAAAAERLCKL